MKYLNVSLPFFSFQIFIISFLLLKIEPRLTQQPIFTTPSSRTLNLPILPKAGLDYLNDLESVHIFQTFELNDGKWWVLFFVGAKNFKKLIKKMFSPHWHQFSESLYRSWSIQWSPICCKWTIKCEWSFMERFRTSICHSNVG